MEEEFKELVNFFIKGDSNFYSDISVDNVIFGYHQKELRILLLRNPNFYSWMLPGGYVKKEETVEEAAARLATQRTGLENLFLKQFKVFSAPGRNKDFVMSSAALSEMVGQSIDPNWVFRQIVSIGFYTLIEFSKAKIRGSFLAEEAKWWSINDLPTLLFDHSEIVKEALAALRLHISHFPIGLELLPNKFTLPEIRTLYETIVGKEMDDRNFTRKLMSLGIIARTSETKPVKGRGHRPPVLYTFNKKEYRKALSDGISVL